MTAETLKPFLSFASGPTTVIGGENMEEKRRKLRLLLIFAAVLFVLFFSATLLSLTIWHSVKVAELRQEVDQLKTKIVELRKHLRFDVYDDLNDLHDFADAYKKMIHDDDDTIYLDGDKEAFGKPTNSKSDDDEDDEKSFEDADFDASGDYYDDVDDYESEKNNIFNDIQRMQQTQIRSNRNRRALAGVTRQGVPIMEESYMEHRRNRSHHDYFHDNQVDSPRLQYKWDDYRNVRRRPHPRTNQFTAHHQPQPQPRKVEEVTPIPLMDRFGNPRGYAQESVRAPTEYAKPPPQSGPHGLGGHNKLFLHLVRDPRDVGSRGHHVQSGVIYNDWVLPGSERSSKFKIDAGVVTILHGGSYYVYAQIANGGKPESFVIERNQSPELSCSTADGDTCFTAGIIFLRPNDVVYVKDVGPVRSRVKDPHLSYFGLVKLD